ncbi:pali-domain-containing protein [Xylariaceae sp. FL0804]|nr:pali-domain-containing protein [Xylariaceae sp. FL0804]
MLRPATPLAVMLFAAFALLLLSVLSTPVITAIPLGTYQDVSFGVFGYCKGDQCSAIGLGYDASKDITTTGADGFDLSSTSTRNTLSAILVVHPVACFLTLVMFILAVVAHLHSPSHSSRYLCAVFVFGIITFLVCLLAFLVDVLLFIPHLAWGSYLVLAATIIVLLCFVMSCAMRRTLVSRKARKKRIAENAEMSGENYYNRQATLDVTTPAAAVSQPTMPVISGANGPADKGPAFASYERKEDRSSDERVPLTARSPSDRSPNHMPSDLSQGDTMYSAGRSQAGLTPSPPRDRYGNPMNQPPDAYGMRRGPSADRMNGRGRGGPPGGYRGRGGYGRGAYGGGYGPPNGRGGRNMPYSRGGGYPPRGGGYPPRGGYGGQRPRGPPPNYPGGPGYQGAPREDSMTIPAGPSGMNQPAPGDTAGPAGAGNYGPYDGQRGSELPRAESPPPLPGFESSSQPGVGQAVAMGAVTGSPAHAPADFGQFNNHLRDSDADVAGMLALQEARTSAAQRHDTLMTEGSKYSQDGSQYVPPRQAWEQGPGRSSPAHPSQLPPPLQIPTRGQGLGSGTPPPPPAGNYYEDVDPRFTESAPRPQDPRNNSGSRSPAASDLSGFTSISQRGVNPHWNSGPGQGYGQQMPPRRPVNRNDVNILNSNPEFQLPSSRGPSNSPARATRGGIIPGSAYPGV